MDIGERALVEVDSTGGQPSGIAFDAAGALHAADLAVGAIMQREAVPDAESGGAAAGGAGAHSGAWISSVVDYEGEPMRGPTSLATSPDGTLFFTDSGPLGEATLDSPVGSVFAVVGSGGGRFLKPILLKSLAHPCGVAVGAGGKVVYVAEMLRNRILRLVQRPAGVFHASVFHQLSGRMGPSAVAVDERRGGTLYVAHFDAAESGATRSEVLILGADGVVQGSIDIDGPELSGLALSPDGKHLAVTEASTGSVYLVRL